MRVMFFAPHAAIWYHAFPEALVAESLIRSGHDVLYVTCGRLLDEFCVPMAASGLQVESAPDARHLVCHRCLQNEELLREEFGFSGPRLSELVDDKIKRNTANLMSGISRTSAANFAVDDISVGRLALYNVLNRKKKLALDLDDGEWTEYQLELKNLLNILQTTGKLFDSFRPDRVVVYNSLYPANRVVAKLAENRGVPSYFLHAGGNLSRRLQTLLVGRGDTFSFYDNIIGHWSRFSEIPCNPDDIALVTEHYLHLFRGRSVFGYSSASKGGIDIRTHFGISKHQKIVLATMSSLDEIVSAQSIGALKQASGKSAFDNQVDWIKTTIDYIAARPELFLIVRVHPREFPNRRDSVASVHGELLRKSFIDLPTNVRVNWPEDGLSLYDIARETDVALNAWSSTGKELSLLGIPVVIYSADNLLYPADINDLALSPQEYFEKLQSALKAGWSFERSRGAFRWSVFEFNRCVIDIGDSYPALENPDRGLMEKVVSRIKRSIDAEHEQRRDFRRRRKVMNADDKLCRLLASGDQTVLDNMATPSATVDALDRETMAISCELRRLANALFPDPTARASNALYRMMTGGSVGGLARPRVSVH